MYDIEKELRSLRSEVTRIKTNLESLSEVEHRGVDTGATLKSTSKPYRETIDTPVEPTSYRLAPRLEEPPPPRYLEQIQVVGLGREGQRRWLAPNPKYREWEIRQQQALRAATTPPPISDFTPHTVDPPRERVTAEPTKGGLRSIVDSVDELTGTLRRLTGKR